MPRFAVNKQGKVNANEAVAGILAAGQPCGEFAPAGTADFLLTGEGAGSARKAGGCNIEGMFSLSAGSSEEP